MIRIIFAIAVGVLLILTGCGGDQLPVLKETDISFELTNQYGEQVTEADLEEKIYVADFFFTSCPTICPDMKEQMLRVYSEFKNNERVKLVSHTIDPEHDTIPVLKDYAKRIQQNRRFRHHLFSLGRFT